jgi:hypothetical protein
MELKNIVAQIIQTANEMDEQNEVDTADKLTAIAHKLITSQGWTNEHILNMFRDKVIEKTIQAMIDDGISEEKANDNHPDYDSYLQNTLDNFDVNDYFVSPE